MVSRNAWFHFGIHNSRKGCHVGFPGLPLPSRSSLSFFLALKPAYLGLLAEEIDVRGGELLGNFPQPFSNVGLINAAYHIDEARRKVDRN